MSDIAIRIENLGKRYRYGGAAPLSANLRAELTDWIRGVFLHGSPQPTVQSPQSTPSKLRTRDHASFHSVRIHTFYFKHCTFIASLPLGG